MKALTDGTKNKPALRRRTVGLPPEPRTHRGVQGLFDRIVTAVRRQGYLKSEGDWEACMYYGPDGVRCHVGLVIPPDEYRPEFEGRVPRVLQEEGLFFLGWSDDEMDLLEDFQGIHDDYEPHRWETAFAELAAERGLIYTRPRNGT